MCNKLLGKNLEKNKNKYIKCGKSVVLESSMDFAPQKIVCVFAHPDDEVFGPGGTIACFAQTAEVHLVCVTDGGADSRFTHGNVSGSELANIRHKELMDAAAILGVKSVTFLGYKDGSLCNNTYHEVVRDIESVVDKIKPDSLLTLFLNGVSGHLDHVAVSMQTSYVFEQKKYIRTLYYYVHSFRVKKMLRNKYFVFYPPGFTKSEVDWVHDISPFYRIKLKAMEAHSSQLRDFLIIRTLFGSLLKTEMFKVVRKRMRLRK